MKQLSTVPIMVMGVTPRETNLVLDTEAMWKRVCMRDIGMCVNVYVCVCM